MLEAPHRVLQDTQHALEGVQSAQEGSQFLQN